MEVEEGIVFTKADTIDEDELVTYIRLGTAAGNSSVSYPLFKDGRKKAVKEWGTTLEGKLLQIGTGQLEAGITIEFLFQNSEPDNVYITTKYKTATLISVDAGITPEAKEALMNLFTPPPFDVSTLPKVKVPKGQADHIFWVPIEDGTVMADFKNERDGFHRYYTKAGMDRMNPLVNMGTNLPLQQSDITYYIAQLDDSMQPTFTGNADGGRRGRKTRRTRRTRRNKRGSRT